MQSATVSPSSFGSQILLQRSPDFDRKKNLAQLNEQISELGVECLRAPMAQISTFLGSDSLQCSLGRHLYPLFSRVMEITKELLRLPDSQLKDRVIALWDKVLEDAQGTPCSFNIGKMSGLDFSITRQLIKDGELTARITTLDENANKDLLISRMRFLEKKIFGFPGLIPDLALKVLDQPELVCVLAQDDADHLLGYAYGAKIRTYRGKDVFYVCGLGRAPAAAKLGIGSQVLEKIESVAKERWPELDAFALNVALLNKDACKLYSRTGYYGVELNPDYYQTREGCNEFEPGIFMVKPIGDMAPTSVAFCEQQYAWRQWMEALRQS